MSTARSTIIEYNGNRDAWKLTYVIYKFGKDAEFTKKVRRAYYPIKPNKEQVREFIKKVENE